MAQTARLGGAARLLDPSPSPPVQGVDRWLLKVQRAADVSFDRFEASALEQSFHVPDGLMAVAPPPAASRSMPRA